MNSVSRFTLVAVSLSGIMVLAHGGCSDDNNTITDGGAGSGGSNTGGTGGTGTGGGTGGSVGSGGTGTGGGAGDAGTSSGDAGLDGGGDGGIRLTDSEAAGVMMEANSGEVMIGNLATTKAMNAQVMAFAQQMVTEHTMANNRLMMLLQSDAGITAASSSTRQMLAMMAQMTLTQLSGLTGAAFDSAYISSQVTMHQQVLTLLDQVLIPSAQNAALKTELMSARATVMMHLTAAQTLAAMVGGADGGAGLDAATDGP
jgi:putative membrane protein